LDPQQSLSIAIGLVGVSAWIIEFSFPMIEALASIRDS
jgi:hypothetical protein